MRKFIDLIESAQRGGVTAEKAEQILSSYRVARGVKIPKNSRFWRGESAESGSGMASLGRGLYTTLNRKYAAQFGNVVEYSRDDIPWNGLRFDNHNDFQIWLQDSAKVLGLSPNLVEFNTLYNSIDDFIHELDPEIDGLQVNKGKESIFVSFPNHERYRKLARKD